MCLKALSCFHASSVLVQCMILLGVTRMLSKNQYLFVQVCKELKQPNQVFSRHYGVDHYRILLFKIFVFIAQRTVELHQSSSQPILLHLCNVLEIAASFSCCGENVQSDILQCGCYQHTWVKLLCMHTCYSREKTHMGARS